MLTALTSGELYDIADDNEPTDSFRVEIMLSFGLLPIAILQEIPEIEDHAVDSQDENPTRTDALESHIPTPNIWRISGDSVIAIFLKPRMLEIARAS